MKRIFLLFIPVTAILVLFSCKKEAFITSADARLSLSTDSIKFDTVFTTVGSVTQSFKIFNNNNQKLLISRLKLMGGNASAFKININGTSTSDLENIEIDANDSIYVFVSVSINPSTANLPFIISDSISILYNGNTRFVQLQAYGQNAHFFRNRVISSNTIWTNDLPYVILGGLRIDTAVSLTIEQGCRIYAHADAPILVDGTLRVNGIKGNEVVFTGDRLDEPYVDFPASWPGIYFRESSKDNSLTYAVVKNAYQAVVLQEPASNSQPKLMLHRCIIDNAYDAGLMSIGSSVEADNTLISNCGKNIQILLGGQYTFTHCMVVAYSNPYITHKVPVLVVANHADQNGSTVTRDLNAVFRNSVFWGSSGFVENELFISRQGANAFSIMIDHCLYRAVTTPSNAVYNLSLVNQDPVFDSINSNRRYFDFRNTNNPGSPLIDNGVATGFLKDLDNNNRNVGLPDLGCYEKQ